jgi:uncharacterized protein (DUF1810 family)
MTSFPDQDFNLARFVAAQHTVYQTVVKELRAGRKQTHWIWFVFPQVDGLGRSPTAKYYSVKSRREAITYLAHPQLGMRLRECTELALGHRDKTAHQIFGSPDDLKFRSSMTLFDAIGGQSLYRTALKHFYGGQDDKATLDILERWP